MGGCILFLQFQNCTSVSSANNQSYADLPLPQNGFDDSNVICQWSQMRVFPSALVSLDWWVLKLDCQLKQELEPDSLGGTRSWGILDGPSELGDFWWEGYSWCSVLQLLYVIIPTISIQLFCLSYLTSLATLSIHLCSFTAGRKSGK